MQVSLGVSTGKSVKNIFRGVSGIFLMSSSENSRGVFITISRNSSGNLARDSLTPLNIYPKQLLIMPSETPPEIPSEIHQKISPRTFPKIPPPVPLDRNS